jgi:hypothetical protein
VPEPTTPPPLYYTGPGKATAPPSPMSPLERATYRAAALYAVKLYPGPIGELAQRELRAHDEFGWVLGANSLLTRLRDQMLEEWAKWEAEQAASRGIG